MLIKFIKYEFFSAQIVMVKIGCIKGFQNMNSKYVIMKTNDSNDIQ
jgi:hypothetical protein